MASSLGQSKPVTWGSSVSSEYQPAILTQRAVAADLHLSPTVAQKEMEVVTTDTAILSQPTEVGLTGEQRPRDMTATVKKLQTDTLALLTPSQRVRYRQLSLQVAGTSALLSTGLDKTIGLTKTQRHNLMVSVVVMTHKIMRFRVHTRGPMPAGFTPGRMILAARHAQETASHNILTPAQWAKWSVMQGKKLPELDAVFLALNGIQSNG